MLEEFLAHPATDLHQLVVVRHAKAGRRGRFTGDDADRPLDEEGRRQAEALVPLLDLYGVHRLSAADRVRCLQTFEPLAQRLHTEIQLEKLLTEEAYDADPGTSYARLLELAAPSSDGVRAVCSQGKAIAPLLERWADDDGVSLPSSRYRKGSVWILTLDGHRLIQADHIPSPLPGGPDD
ncbi:SixA phosphatase family protein [Gordonia sp. (in: high G+C Gram-positive bacteria)]|uniref:SixA phosphatase family protein n=1 Tax=Gordonia sp. (in: high G+C Gram-positive bacteria) TaxID=84139 RepID=UPI0039E3D862